MLLCVRTQIATLTLLLAASVSLRADIKLRAPAPPQADAQAVRVRRGGALTIPLRAHYGGGGMVSFAIEKRPQHGALSDLRRLGDNRATIVYQNDPASSVAADRFTYVVKSSDRVSSPAEVTILIEEAPPKLRVPDRIEFAEIRAGESASRSFAIANAGGGVLEGRLTVSAPWALGVATYRVKAEAPAAVELVFRPTEARSFVGQVTLLGSDGAQTAIPLVGSASSPLDVEPPELQISLPRETRERRSGVVALTNRTERELPLKLEASAKPSPPPPAAPATPGVAAVSRPQTIAKPSATPSAEAFVALRALRLDSTRWELHWKQPPEPVANYRIEERLLALNGSELETSWRTLDALEISRSGDEMVARISGLASEQLHMLRVTALNARGATLWESPLVALAPPRAAGRGGRGWLIVFGVALAVLVVLRWRARRA